MNFLITSLAVASLDNIQSYFKDVQLHIWQVAETDTSAMVATFGRDDYTANEIYEKDGIYSMCSAYFGQVRVNNSILLHGPFIFFKSLS